MLLWLPFIIFFSILLTMMATRFSNPTDEYFVSTVLRACLILIIATAIAQVVAITAIFGVVYTQVYAHISVIEGWLRSLSSLPLVDIGIYSTALFFAFPQFSVWHQVIAFFLLLPTVHYWLLFLKGPIRNLHQFAQFHQVRSRRITNVLSSFYIAAFVDYFFIVLKRTLLPLVFVLSVMDYRIMLPRLVEAGMSLSAFVMFVSLIVSLHLLTAGKDRQK